MPHLCHFQDTEKEKTPLRGAGCDTADHLLAASADPGGGYVLVGKGAVPIETHAGLGGGASSSPKEDGEGQGGDAGDPAPTSWQESPPALALKVSVEGHFCANRAQLNVFGVKATIWPRMLLMCIFARQRSEMRLLGALEERLHCRALHETRNPEPETRTTVYTGAVLPLQASICR